MPCALCLKDEKLCRSHILPELFYKPIYSGEKPHFYTVSTDPKDKPLKRQTGIWERLLCEACESRLSNWERIASVTFYQQAAIRELPGRLEIHDLDYEAFKLFQLSVLWRAGVSKRPEFSSLSLGPHAERLRKMLVSGDPGRSTRYGCYLVLCPDYKNELQRLIISPDMVKGHGHRVARFVLAGLFWSYFVSSHPPDFAVRHDVFLREDGVLPISIESEFTSRYLESLFVRWKKSGNMDDVLGRP